MPTYTVLLAQDVTYYGNVSVEGDTWQEAVASLTLSDWDECYEQGDGAWDQHVVHVEDEAGDFLAEDLAYNKHMVYRESVIQRLHEILYLCGDVPDDTAAALVAFIDELRAMGQDPIFKKETQA
jgi:hypothetical protein